MSYRQESAIAALLCSPTIPEAAKTAGVCERTLFRWLQDPVFQQSYRAARREAVSQAIAGLQKASSEAVQTLRDVMADAEASATSRVSAAKGTLDLALKAVELEDLAERIEALEQNAVMDRNR